jgi:hypothetical protein
MNSDTLTWWLMLCGVSALNVALWLSTVTHLHFRSDAFRDPKCAYAKWHMILSAGYVIGCGYRSLFPVYDVQRIVMVDSWLSSVIVGRSVATVAELCFAAQWALLLRGFAQSSGSARALTVSRLIVPFIVVAEICSWYAVLTTSNLGHVMEESIWGLCAALLVASFVAVWPRSHPNVRPVLLAAGVAGLGYAAYMFKVDVPMYWARYVLDEGRGHQYLSIAQGVADASGRWVVSRNWRVWETEVVWMSLYFSVAVWLSISLMHVAANFKGVARELHMGRGNPRPGRGAIVIKNFIPS